MGFPFVNVLTVNTGGVTLQLAVVRVDVGADHDRHDHVSTEVLSECDIDPWVADDDDATAGVVDQVVRDRIDRVAHRIVHDGGGYDGPVIVDDHVVAAIERASTLAPLHHPRHLAAMRFMRRAFPEAVHVACFDTTFHRTMPATATTYAIPWEWRAEHGVRRLGFHGLSHAHVARRVPAILGHPARRIVSCHLGSGGSVCAIVDDRSIDTTMGFTPDEGIVMKVRSGSIDPGALTWLIDVVGLDAHDVAVAVRERSGLAALSGTSGDMRDVLAARRTGRPEAQLAFDVYVHRLRAAVAALTASCGGLDALAFTGAIGVHVAEVRSHVCAGLDFLGIVVDEELNDAVEADGSITADGSTVDCVVVSTGEHIELARSAATVRRVGT